MKPSWIDVHSHFLPQQYLDAMTASGAADVDGFPLPHWSVEAHLDAMDRGGVTSCVLSISSPGIGFVRGAHALELARSINQTARDIIDRHPERFGAFAVLPLPDIDGALAEITHSLDVLELDGVGLLSNYDGKYLGEPCFEPLLSELDRRRATVFVHPTAPPGFERLRLGLDVPAPAIEFMFDTTRMVVSLAGWGRLAQYPNLRLIVPHGGGTVPYLCHRIAAFASRTVHQAPGIRSEDVLRQFRTLFFDTTFANSAPVLSMLSALVAPAQLLAGFDFPFMRAGNMGSSIGAHEAYPGFGPDQRRAISHGNALRLLPRLAARLGSAPASSPALR